MATFLLAAAALVAGQSLEELSTAIRGARDPDTFDAGWQAARVLAGREGTEAMRLRLALYDRLLDSWRGVYLRDWLYSGMRKAGSSEEAALLATAARSARCSLLLRRLCLRALAAAPASLAAAELLHPSFDRGPPALRREWQRTLGLVAAAGRLRPGREGAQVLAERIRKRLRRAGPPYSGLAALPGLSPEDLRLLLKAVRTARDSGDRAEALRALAGRADAALLLEALAAGLADEALAPRVAALEAAVTRREARSVPILLDALEAEEARGGGRLLSDVEQALTSLTGQQLGRSAARWRLWWAADGEAFLARGCPALRTRAGQAGLTVARLFGLPVDSLRVAVVVDGSGSMQRERLGTESCAEAARREVASFLERLPDGARFTLALAADTPQLAFRQPVPADPGHCRAAAEFLGRHEFGGTSALYEVLASVMKEQPVDTLVLIGDGGSSAGAHQFSGHLLEALAAVYARTGVRIHTVCVGKDPPKQRFLAELARITGGHAVQAEPDPAGRSSVPASAGRRGCRSPGPGSLPGMDSGRAPRSRGSP